MADMGGLMNIAFDAIALLGPMSKNRGIGNYAFSQLKTLIRNDRNNNYFFFNVLEETDIFQEEVQEGLLREVYFPIVLNGRPAFSEGYLDIYGSLLKNFLMDNQIDIFYITSPFETAVPVYCKEWFGSTRVVSIVYDIIPYVMRDHYFPNPADMDWYMKRVEMLRWSDRYVVISQSVKDDMVSYLNFPAEKIDVIWGAPHGRFKEIDISEHTRETLYKKFKINSQFIMCTGGDDERKNIATLISAFGKLSTELTKKYQLVIVCKLQDASIKRYHTLARNLGVESRVVLTNFVTDDELLQLYNLALLVAFPSIYEGFGLPVVEAWACGTPVLTSNNSSLVQIGGNAAVLVDPFSEEDIRRGLEYALTSVDLKELADKGKERLQEFQWNKVAQLTVESFEKVGKIFDQREKVTKRKIAFFSPLPPVQSGISDYSVDILYELSKYFDIDVYIDFGYKVDCHLPTNIRILSYKDYEVNRTLYFDTIFQMGNSEYHVYMWKYLRKYGGTLVLHDYNMHGAFQYKALAQDNNINLYREIVKEELGTEVAEKYIQDVSQGARLKLRDLELNAYLTNYADRIIVHSAESKRKLLMHDSHRNVEWIHHYAKIDEIPDKKIARDVLKLPQDAFIVAAFGHVHETKRAIPIIQAFAKFAEEYENAQLIFVGKLDPSLEKEFTFSVNNLGLANRVSVTGYTELGQFERYIDATDICVNLRWPYNGETSGSLMRILAKGKCVIVNNIGSFAEIPDEACVKLPPVEQVSAQQEINVIARALKELKKDSAKREKLQKAARKFAEDELDIEIIGKKYAGFIARQRKTVVTENLLMRLKDEVTREKITDRKMRQLAIILAHA